MIDFLTSGPSIIALLIVTILGIITGVDNIRFIDVATSELEAKKKNNAINISVLLSFLLRITLLLIAYWVMTLTAPFWDINMTWFHTEISGQALLLLVGGLFLLYKGTAEIHEEVEDKNYDVRKITSERSASFGKSIWQTTVINLVFSFDVVLLAIGLTNGLDGTIIRVIALIAIGLCLSLLAIILFKDQLQRIMQKHPSIHILGLAFFILTGFSMLAEGAYLSHTHLFGSDIGFLPKNYIYIAISISLIFMFSVVKFRKENVKGEIQN